ncbi:hypothetical protein N7481_012233 [Penicillium waksmanii]|uniref:uncharacterized protein n=1 Tax=Penicillium waksmanii TaxID=69791 RepID=UPI0025475BBA|nr:uncharacterized protein N7481_012233 [Penicillium waksmanii]KAJ5965519.1 hypothetical protein N7481_012233 [Penicillium waksmanii]
MKIFWMSVFALCALASGCESPYDCSAIQIGNKQYNLSPLSGNYETIGFVDKRKNLTTSYAINICSDLNAAVSRTFPTPLSADHQYNGQRVGFSVSDIGTLFDGRYSDSVLPKAEQLERHEGFTLKSTFNVLGSEIELSMAVIDFICDPTRSGLEFLKGYHLIGEADDHENRNSMQNGEPSLRFLSWTRYREGNSLLHLEWKTRQACDSHAPILSESRSLKDFFNDSIWRPSKQMKIGL